MSRQRSTNAASLVALAVLATACAGDPSRASARDARSRDGDELVPPPAEPPRDTADASAFSAPESRPRLRHTITLGETHGEGSLRGPPSQRGGSSDDHAPSPTGPPPPVTYFYPAYGYGYGDPAWYGGPGGYGWRDVDTRRERDAKPSPSNPPALGQDWAPPKPYGPRFPFKTAPADPWK